MTEPKWRALKVGDKARVTCWPDELRRELLHAETVEIYEWIIRTGYVATVVRIDHEGLPYVEVCRVVDGQMEWHYLALNHSGVEIV